MRHILILAVAIGACLTTEAASNAGWWHHGRGGRPRAPIRTGRLAKTPVAFRRSAKANNHRRTLVDLIDAEISILSSFLPDDSPLRAQSAAALSNDFGGSSRPARPGRPHGKRKPKPSGKKPQQHGPPAHQHSAVPHSHHQTKTKVKEVSLLDPFYMLDAPDLTKEKPASYDAPKHAEEKKPQATYGTYEVAAPIPSQSSSYSAPVATEAPAYKAPEPSYNAPPKPTAAPSYSAPEAPPSYSAPEPPAAPAYTAPQTTAAPAYKAPETTAAPSYQAPSYAPPTTKKPVSSYSAPKTPKLQAVKGTFVNLGSSYKTAPTKNNQVGYGPFEQYKPNRGYLPPKTTSAPEPAYNAPEPAYKTPEPAYKSPEPAYKTPEPAYNAPEPAYNAPEPAYKTPEPAYKTPEPAYNAPEPAYNAPEPAYNAPEPAYKSPEPAYKSPEPAYKSPEPAYKSPEPAYTTAAPAPAAYQPPSSGYQKQKPFTVFTAFSKKTSSLPKPSLPKVASYGAPAATQTYGAPANTYAQPEPAYDAPAPAYQQPEPAYDAPAPAYQQPEPVYDAPAPAYQQPQTAYETPAPAYQAQSYQTGYQTPEQQYDVPEGYVLAYESPEAANYEGVPVYTPQQNQYQYTNTFFGAKSKVDLATDSGETEDVEPAFPNVRDILYYDSKKKPQQ